MGLSKSLGKALADVRAAAAVAARATRDEGGVFLSRDKNLKLAKVNDEDEGDGDSESGSQAAAVDMGLDIDDDDNDDGDDGIFDCLVGEKDGGKKKKKVAMKEHV